MSTRHPIIAITGSSGAGTTTVKHTFEKIFTREKITAAFIEGDAFHRYDRAGMRSESPRKNDAAIRTSPISPGGQRTRNPGIRVRGIWPARHRQDPALRP